MKASGQKVLHRASEWIRKQCKVLSEAMIDGDLLCILQVNTHNGHGGAASVAWSLWPTVWASLLARSRPQTKNG